MKRHHPVYNPLPARRGERRRDIAIGAAAIAFVALLVGWPLYAWLAG